MRAWWLAALLALGCSDTRPCAKGTLFLTLTFDAAAQAADTLHVTVTVGGHALSDDVKRKPGGARGTVEVDFGANGYPAGQSIDVAVVALANGSVLGAGGQSITLTGACGALAFTIGLTGDGGMPDLGADGPIVPQPKGAVCGANGECLSGNCVDGFCCDGACTGACEACDVDNNHGICSPVGSGQPHHKAPCANAGMPCGGVCSPDSRTACKFPGGTTSCRAQACTANLKTFAAGCDGAGNCPALKTASCPNGCDATISDCLGACQNDAQCTAPGLPFCNSGTCLATRPDGRACGTAGDCTSGNCIDGFCCDTQCGANCQACDVAGNQGTCTTLISGQPHHKTACAGTGTCGGSCQGQTSCTFAVPGTICTPQSCSGSTVVFAQTCDGAGTCASPVPASASCGSFTCNSGGTDCLTSCTISSQCSNASDVCFNMACCAPACSGKSCGPDGCGGNCAPGCNAGEVCKPDGTCCGTTCGTSCGGPDGCGGTCGCGFGETCSGGACCARCRDATGCGPIICGLDNCGNNCGTCPASAPKCCSHVCKPVGTNCNLPCG